MDIEKPAPYQERKLKSEKTGEGKLKGPKRFMQNLTTRFNYVFNANVKFEEILERAKEQHRDDFTRLLSFYNYDLDATAADSAQLDSVIYKARTGITNHDLRNDWIDELYLLWAGSWHLQKKFDSASLLLQFINYAYAPKYEDGFYKHIGTNADGARELSIATPEEKRLLSNNTVSRNNAFLWQIRTLTELGNMASAGSLISTLRRDPAFPQRLTNNLDEVEAYWHYRQQRWDSAAVYLLAALKGDYPKLEKARWRYLAAQLMERSGRNAEALALYNAVVSSTPDPVMEVYARLNTVRLSKEGGEDATDKNLAELLKMARRDKYEDYRDIIYYMAAQMELERGNIGAASDLLIKGSKYASGDQSQKNRAFLQIADASWQQKKYLQAASFYDSVEVLNLEPEDGARVTQRKAALRGVVVNSGVVARQDSLQRIAALPEEERNTLVKAMVKKLRKQQGLKDEPVPMSGGSSLPAMAASNPPADLFGQQKGEWYFYNQTTRTQGAAQFKAVWGNRPNVDNWRRFSMVSQQQAALNQPNPMLDVPDPNAPRPATNMSAGNDLSVEGLLEGLPLTAEKLTVSNDSIRTALFALGTAYLNEVDDLPAAIATFEELRRRFPDAEKMDELLFHLFYAYGKTNNTAAAAEAKRLLTTNHPSSRYTAIVTTGKDPVPNNKVAAPEATRAYENVYSLFIEGRFAEAEGAKKIADSTYKTTFWQPQLLYIESVYYIRQREDSVAKNILQTIIRQNTHQGLTQKATTLLNVLNRRKEIEEELTRLQITRPGEDTAAGQPVAIAPAPVPKDTAAITPPAVDPAALALARQKKVSDSLALEKKRLDALEAAKKDSIALAKKAAAEALTDSLALAKKAADEARRDSLARKALADKQKADSLTLAKQLAADAKRDSLARKALRDKQVADSMATVRRDALARKALAAQRQKDSLLQAKAARDQARKDSLELAQALAKSAKDAAALQKYLEQRAKDSLARMTRDSLALAKQKADDARRDSLARKAVADQRKKDSMALALQAAAEAKRDALARKALADKQKADSLALARQLAADAKRDSLAQAALARKQKADSLAAARRDSMEQKALAAKNLRDSLAQARRDSLAQAQALAKQRLDSLALAKQAQRTRDSLERIKPPVRKADVDPNAYYFEPEKPHFALVVLDKVDPIFVGEAKNAFTRYNKDVYASQQLDIQIVNITADVRVLVVSGLSTADAAADYISKAKSVAATEIVPWLTGNKYSFSLISARNLELLKTKADVPAYNTFLEQHLPGKF